MTREHGAVVVTLHGELDLACSVRLGAVLGDLIDGQGNLDVKVDLSHVEGVDPAGLGVFAAGLKLARHHGGALTVMGLSPGPTPRVRAGANGGDTHRHLVEFYESEELLAGSVRAHIEPGLRGHDAVIIVATEEHRALFEATLSRSGVDVGAARAAGRYVDLDAEETLSRFMVDGSPDPGRFWTAIGDLVATTGSGRRVRIYGEMVAVLWAEDNVSAAIALEDLWNDLADVRPFSLLCAYPTTAFDRMEHTSLFRRLCQQHSPVAGGD